MPIGDIVVRIRGDETSFSAAAKRARSENRRFHNSVFTGARRSTTGLQNLERSVFRLRARMIGLRTVAGGVGGFFAGRGIVAVADDWKLTQSRIAATTGSLETAKGEMAEMVALSNRSRGSINTLANAYSKLRLSRDELNKENTFDLIETLQKSLVIGGNTPQEVRSVILQLTQGIAADQLGGEELRTIRESGFFFQKILAEGLGVTVGELKGLGAESKLTAKAVTEAIVRMSDRVNEEFEKIPVTVGQSTILLNNSFREYIGGADAATGATGVLAEGVQLLARNLDPVVRGGLITGAATGAVLLARNVGAAGNKFGETAASALRYELSLRKTGAAAAVSARQQIAASTAQRAAALNYQAQIIAGNVTFSSARARTLELMRTRKLLASTNAQVAASERALAVAIGQSSIAKRGAALAGTALRGALAFIGGPIGAAVLAVAGGFALWASNARKAKERTAELITIGERVAGILRKQEDGTLFFTAEGREQALSKATSAVERYRLEIEKTKSELQVLNNIQSGSLRFIERGNASRSVKVPGRALSAEESNKQSRALATLKVSTANLASAEKARDLVVNSAGLTIEEYNKKQKELNNLVSPIPEDYVNSLDKLRDRVSLLNAEYKALSSGGSVQEATTLQETINQLRGEGVVVTAAMTEELRKLAKAEAELTKNIGDVESYNTAIERLRSSVAESKADLAVQLNPGANTEAAAKALEIYNGLVENGVTVTQKMKDEIQSLSEQYGANKTAIEEAKEAQDTYNDRLDDAKNLAKEFQTPLQEYRERMKEITALHKEFPQIFNGQALERARVEAVSEYENAIRSANDEQRRLAEGLAESVVNADSLGGALQSIGSILQQTLAEKFLIDPLTGIIDSGLSGIGGAGAANDNDSSKQVDQFGNIVDQAGKKVQGGFITSIASSVTSLFTRNAADTAATAVTATKTAAETADTAVITAHTATTGASTASLAALTASATSASVALATVSAQETASSFAGFFANGGIIPQGQFGVVGEQGRELVSAASGPLQITPLSKVTTATGGGGSSQIVYAPTYSVQGASQGEINQLKAMMAEDRENFTSRVRSFEFDRRRGAA